MSVSMSPPPVLKDFSPIQAPNDSLDFQLKAVYDHHKDIFKTKNQFLFQAETVYEEQRWVCHVCSLRQLFHCWLI